MRVSSGRRLGLRGPVGRWLSAAGPSSFHHQEGLGGERRISLEVVVKKVLLVCGYGCALTDGLERYLDRVSKFARDWNPDILILSGGFTQRMSFHHVSEARVMEEYLVAKNPKLIYAIVRDEQAYTTPDNLSNAAQILRDKGVAEGEREVVIFCDALRALKVAIYAEDHLGQVTIETVHLDRSSAKGQIIPTLQAFVARRFPLVDRIHRSLRIRRSQRL